MASSSPCQQAGCKDPDTEGLAPLCLQSYCTAFLETHAPTQVDPRASTELWAWDHSSPLTLLPHGTSISYSVPGAQCHTHKRAPVSILCYSADTRRLPPHRGPVLTTKPSSGRAPTALSKSRNPDPPLSDNLPFCERQETCFPKAQKGPMVPPILDHRRVPALPSNNKNARFPTEEKKAVTCYSVDIIRRPAFPKCI
jgi:hypothetical protein